MAHQFAIVILTEEYRLNDKPGRLYSAANDLLWPYRAEGRDDDETPCKCVGEDGSADPECEACEGLGVAQNEDAIWDWWSVGGRWNGYIQGRPAPPPGCLASLFSTGRQIRQNIALVRDIPPPPTGVAAVEIDIVQYTDKDGPKLPRGVVPFAVVEPNGTWHDEARFTGEYPDFYQPSTEEWVQHVRDLLSNYPDHVAVGIDFHS